MDENLIEVDVGVGLNDSELIFYDYNKKNDRLRINIQTWDSNIVQICCDNPILFIDRGCGETTMFCEKKSGSDLLKKTLEKNYDNGLIPDNHPYKLYQLLDLDDNPVLEIICKSIESQKIK